jgi:hypothetical protein
MCAVWCHIAQVQARLAAYVAVSGQLDAWTKRFSRLRRPVIAAAAPTEVVVCVVTSHAQLNAAVEFTGWQLKVSWLAAGAQELQ